MNNSLMVRNISSITKFKQLALERHVLSASYRKKVKGRTLLLEYSLRPNDDSPFYDFILIIEEGFEDHDLYLDECSERYENVEFLSIDKALEFLKKKESFKLTDWQYSKQSLPKPKESVTH
jgi:hypothetical protein